MLHANHFQVSLPGGYIHHYDINVKPDNCPRSINREIIEIMVHAYDKLFGNHRPAFDGRKNLYTKYPLPIGKEQIELEVGFSFKLYYNNI